MTNSILAVDLDNYLADDNAVRDRIFVVAEFILKAIGMLESDTCMSADPTISSVEIGVGFVRASCGQGGGMSDTDYLDFDASYLYMTNAELTAAVEKDGPEMRDWIERKRRHREVFKLNYE